MACPGWTVLLSCVGMVALGALTSSADPVERTGSDAPHQERNEAKNEKKTALALSEVEVPVVAGKPVRKATAVVKEDSTSRSKAKDTKDKKRADRLAKEKEKPNRQPRPPMPCKNDGPMMRCRMTSSVPTHPGRSVIPIQPGMPRGYSSWRGN